MTAQTQLLLMPPLHREAPPESRPSAPAKEAKAAGPAVYWGDRLTLKFWIICFGLMFAMHLVEALHRLILLLMGPFSAP